MPLCGCDAAGRDCVPPGGGCAQPAQAVVDGAADVPIGQDLNR